MKIRSITCFLDPGWPLDEAVLRQVSEFSAAARQEFSAAGYDVQSMRLATVPFPRLIPSLELTQLIGLAQTLERTSQSLGFDYLSLGPALPDAPHSYALVPDLLAATQNVFFSGSMTESGEEISLPAVRACADVIVRAATISPDGFANLRFCATANLTPGGPFLPSAYHGGGAPRFAIATESADLAVEAVMGASNLAEARRSLVASVESHATRMTAAARQLEGLGVLYGGIDFTLAPYPEESRSFGAAMEALGVPAVGLHGSLAAAAFLTDTLDRANFSRAGFNGLLLPVLEDAVLAARAAQDLLSVKDLLMCSAVCGTGLDCVPLPGDASPEALSAVLLDVAALSQRLDKPLTARLMPIPGKKTGDTTGFEFEFFANSRVLSLDAAPLQGFFSGDEFFEISPRFRQEK